MNVLFMTTSPGQTAVEEPDLGRRDEAALGQASFGELVERRSRFVFRICYALLRNLHDAEDVVQEVFLKLYRSGAWERMEDEQSYLARTAWRMAQDKLRFWQEPRDVCCWLLSCSGMRLIHLQLRWRPYLRALPSRHGPNYKPPRRPRSRGRVPGRSRRETG